MTGCGMEKAQAFLEAVRRAGTPMWVRHVVVPGLTDGEAHMRALAAYIETLPNVQRVQLLPYHTLGVKNMLRWAWNTLCRARRPWTRSVAGSMKQFFSLHMQENRKGDKTDDAVPAVGGLCARRMAAQH